MQNGLKCLRLSPASEKRSDKVGSFSTAACGRGFTADGASLKPFICGDLQTKDTEP
jgi:hypothetical protein